MHSKSIVQTTAENVVLLWPIFELDLTVSMAPPPAARSAAWFCDPGSHSAHCKRTVVTPYRTYHIPITLGCRVLETPRIVEGQPGVASVLNDILLNLAVIFRLEN